MADNNSPPPDIQDKARAVEQWLAEDQQKRAQPPVERAVDRFKRLFTARPDTPPQMPAWDANRKD